MPHANAWVTIADIILVLIVVEACAGSLYFLLTRRGIAPASWCANAVAGGGLLLAMRQLLVGEPGVGVAAALFAAFIAHIVDCRQRWR